MDGAQPASYGDHVNDIPSRSKAAAAALEQRMFDRIAALSPAQRLQVAMDLTESVLEIARANIRQQHPHADERELALRLCARKYGRETMLRFFGEVGLRWCE